MIVEGQVHGGIAQGLGQAILEGCVYDDEGQLVTGSYMDYTMPRADDLPDLKLGFSSVPSPLNPLGVKGCGEAGAIASPAALINAVIDALNPLGVTNIDMPATPQKCGKLFRMRRPNRRRQLRSKTMYDFNYQRADSVADASAKVKASDDGMLMAGGMTLIPTLKQRLAQPVDVVDLEGSAISPEFPSTAIPSRSAR